MGRRCCRIGHAQSPDLRLYEATKPGCSFLFIMAALHSRCGHYIFILWFLLYYYSFFPRQISSGRRLDVCHTSTHGVALVRISDAGLKHAALGSRQMQDAKNRHLGTIAQLCRAISSQLRHVSTIGKKLLSSNISSTCSHNMVNLAQ